MKKIIKPESETFFSWALDRGVHGSKSEGPRDKIFTPVLYKVNPGGCFVIMIPRRKKPTNYNVYNYPATVLAKENVQIFV